MTLTLQLFKNSNDAREKLRLNFHSLSVSELLEYGHKVCLQRTTFISLFPKEIQCIPGSFGGTKYMVTGVKYVEVSTVEVSTIKFLDDQK
jgi:hypothetical protein